MGRGSSLDDGNDEDFFGDDMDEDEFDAEEDALPTTQIVIRRQVDKPIAVSIEATIGEESTFIKFWRTASGPEAFKYCFVDTLDPEMILNTLEGKFELGLLYDVERFFDEYGRSISDPVKFRLKLDAVVQPAAGLTGSTL